MRKRATVFYSGRVQGVGFRYTAREIACGYELTGYVRNLDDGRVELIVRRLGVGEREVLPVTCDTPVIASVFAADPTREMSHFLRELIDLGFSGVINFPSIAWLEGELRASLEASGLGFHREVDMRQAG